MTLTNKFMNTIDEIQNILQTELDYDYLTPCFEYIGKSDSNGARVRFHNNCSIILDRGVEIKDFYRGSFSFNTYDVYFTFGGKGAQETLNRFKEKIKEVKDKICQFDYKKENDQLRKQNEMLVKNNAVQQWCDMYNIKDKECFNALLKLGKYQQAINNIKNACENECIEGNTGYVVDTSIILEIINELQERGNK